MKDKNRLGKHHVPGGGRIKRNQRSGQRGERDPVDLLITKFLERGGRDGKQDQRF